jgi:hypothetical protein
LQAHGGLPDSVVRLFHVGGAIPAGKPIVKIATLSFWLMGNRKYPFDDLGAAQIVISRITRSLTWQSSQPAVMAGHVAAIHVFSAERLPRRGCPAPGYAKASPGFGASPPKL